MFRLTEDEFARLVAEAVAEIPIHFQEYLADVVIDVEPEPDARRCRLLNLDNPRDLLGLYEGTPMTRQDEAPLARLPDRIVLYQRNIERICRTSRQLKHQIRKTVLHEVGHHFGLDEEDLDRLGYG